MASVSPATLAVLLAVATVAGAAFPATLHLERGIPLPSRKVGLTQLSARDSVRHRRMLQSSSSSAASAAADGVVDFPVQGTFNPFLVGLYYTRLQLGSPPKDFYVQIDTGSDVLWVSCNNCNGCPVSSGLQIPLNFFDSGSSSTSSLISCSDQRCALGIEAADSGCLGQTNNQCGYTFQYGDGSGTSGYYVQDMLHLDTIVGGSVTTNSTVPIVFGCSIQQTGDLTKPDRAVDGIFGFGQQGLSVVSQLASQGVTPRVFSHCLKGDDNGGGILVLGEIVEPNIVYTPLVPSQPHYNVNLQSISVGGQSLAIDPSVFSTSGNRGTIVDSGTTLAYLAEPAYGPFLSAINNAVSQNARPVVTKGQQCYLITNSVNDLFPQVSLHFSGGASMILTPQDYLVQQNNIGGTAVWCIGFQKMQGQGVTILGDLILKDKIFVYDIANQRVGWTNYDCSMSVNVSTAENTGRTEFVNAGQLGNDGSPQNRPIPVIIVITFVLLQFVTSCMFL
ncbi:Aspartic proteinase 36 [Linum grandiflorum]